MKNAVLAGLIAGLITGIICAIIGHTYYSMRLVEFTQGTLIELTVSLAVLTVIFGVAFALIYSRFYSLIPGDGARKGAFFGLMIWFIKDVAAGAYVTFVARNIGIGIDFIIGGLYMWVIYGLLIGILYKKE